MENTTYGIRRTLSKVRKMREINSEFQFLSGVQNLQQSSAYFSYFHIYFTELLFKN